MAMYQSINPHTGELIRTYPTATDGDIERALVDARQGFIAWRDMSFAARGQVLNAAADILEAKAAEYARLMASEMGKPISEGQGEVRKCAAACRYYAEHGERFLRPERQPRFSGGEAEINFRPVGVVLAIMPWNFPFWQVFRFASPGMIAGNAVLLKHAPNTPGCALAIEELFREAGVPGGAFQSVFLTNEQSAKVIADPRVGGVTLTGSERAGRSVGKTAGENLKRAVLELGGSDPYVVLKDADIEQAAAVGVRSRCVNAGQVCCAAKRFIIEKDRFDEFVDAYRRGAQELKIGNPADEHTTMGPLAREDLRENLRRQLEQSKAQGAKPLLEIKPDVDSGFYFGPAVLTNVSPQSPALTEELFGPVAVFIPVRGEAEAIAAANDTRYGLSATVWSSDSERANAVARRIEAGTVVVNGFVTSDVALPFGGVKASGYGRELAREGTREFTNLQVVWEG